MESLIHIAHKEVYTKVIHANMMIPQIETRVRIQVALEFFFLHYVMATVLLSQTMKASYIEVRKPSTWDVNAFFVQPLINLLHCWRKHSTERASIQYHKM